MLSIDFMWAISVFISGAICIVYFPWVIYTYIEKKAGQDTAHLIQCIYCNHIFFNYKQAEMVTCPLCKAYLDLRQEETTVGEVQARRRKKRKRIDV